MQVNGPGSMEVIWGDSGKAELRAVGVEQGVSQSEVTVSMANHVGHDLMISWKHPDVAQAVFPENADPTKVISIAQLSSGGAQHSEFTHVKHVFRITFDPSLSSPTAAAAHEIQNYDRTWWVGWNLALTTIPICFVLAPGTSPVPFAAIFR